MGKKKLFNIIVTKTIIKIGEGYYIPKIMLWLYVDDFYYDDDNGEND